MGVRVAEEFKAELDRFSEPDLPSRAEGIRRLGREALLRRAARQINDQRVGAPRVSDLSLAPRRAARFLTSGRRARDALIDFLEIFFAFLAGSIVLSVTQVSRRPGKNDLDPLNLGRSIT
jgi:hypothetical protein